ncbi:excinuclease ABC subunit B [Clostridium carboxidivorans P7]|nr:excinuclease ABC subunit UvrB [Clostridium carboxidivorans]AKN32872.1 excinuclease ABC subunit B [Clostridium carboxidivorans P7]EFG89883.1 excinuclease ABC subunit B [Clostridium carboxidivorans P7]
MKEFKIHSKFKPTGDQPQAIDSIVKSINDKEKFQTLLGVTGSGKTFTMANIIERVKKPTLVLAHNKTLAAQLCSEFREFFPENCVEYFVSYYDYYQPEAYVAQTDTYIEKDASINDEIDKLRHSATSALLERTDVVVVASVSCIYGLGNPEEYKKLTLSLREGMTKDRDEVLKKLVEIQYERNEINFVRGTFRVKGDVLDIFPASSSGKAIRIEFFGDEIDRIKEFDALTGETIGTRKHVSIFPASHFATSRERLEIAIKSIESELEERVRELTSQDKLLEAQRLKQRTNFDIEMMREVGYCSGIENYSRILDGRAKGTPPQTLIDYFPEDYLLFIDESHVTIPQVKAMYAGDRSRKESLVEYGFRLPSAFDNRPLTFNEFEGKLNQVLFVSATPANYELEHSTNVAEQIIRPTGLLDPEIEVKPIKGQIDDLYKNIVETIKRGYRILVTTLTKKMAEDLSDYFKEMDIKANYLHSGIDTIQRMEIIRDLRKGEFDVLIGINLLREGLDIPEVALVAILDADKEGFLRSERSLIQTIGRAARNSESKVIMYADRITDSMGKAISETNRRRKIQMEYNEKHNIVPKTIKKEIREVIEATKVLEENAQYDSLEEAMEANNENIDLLISKYEKEMKQAAKELQFELAADLRDKILKLKKQKKKN